MNDTVALPPADRTVMRVIGGLTAVIGVFSVALGIAHIVALIDGSAKVALLAHGDLPGTSIGADITTVEVAAGVLDAEARGLFIAGTAVDVATGAVIIVAVVAVLLRIAAGDPFHRSLIKVGVAAAFALLIGGMLGTGVRGIGQMQAAMTLNGSGGGPFEPAFTFDPGSWWLAFVVLALAMVFRIGSRLQRDTEGLV